MKKNFARLFISLALFTIFGVAAAPRASGQQNPVFVVPTPFYRFQVSYWDGGHLLTGYFGEGTANNYTYDPINYPTSDGLGIYVPPSGYTPDPASGLVPLHRWAVIQNGWRTYFYYSTYYASYGGDYHYNGIAGYVFAPGRTSTINPFSGQSLPLHQLSVWYSQDLGFWNGYGSYGYSSYVEPPPNRSGKQPYYDQGIIAALPPGCPQPNPPGSIGCGPYTIRFDPPPPPPPPGSCNTPQFIKNKCVQQGGWWDDETCECQY
jgi:hypothetical protein